MELVLVERRFDKPVTFGDIQKLEDEGSWCLRNYKVRFIKTFFSRDRKRMICLYEAPDAESVRLAEEQANVPYDKAWTCIPVSLSGEAQYGNSEELVVVERMFPAPATLDFVSNALRRAGWCLDLHHAVLVESFLGSNGLQMVCIFRAPDAESVRLANKQGGVPYAEVWTATLHTPAAINGIPDTHSLGR